MKQICAKEALKLIRNGMIVGLGGGTTISYLVDFISEENLDVRIVTPSFTTEKLCIEKGLNVLPTWSVDFVDIAFDGCDAVDFELNALKSGGAIHTKEKLIARMANEYILLVDESKVFDKLPVSIPIVLEVLPEAFSYVCKQIKLMHGNIVQRLTLEKDGGIVSDHGNLILDVYFNEYVCLEQLNNDLMKIQGIVDTSLFYQIASKVLCTTDEGSIVVIE